MKTQVAVNLPKKVVRKVEEIAKKQGMSRSEYIRELVYEYTFTFTELRKIVKARRNGWKIKKGEKYIRQNNVDETSGDFYTYKAIPAIHDICIKNDVYIDL